MDDIIAAMNSWRLLTPWRLAVFVVFAAAVLLAVIVTPGPLILLVMLAILYGAFRLVTGPLPRLASRIGVSVRWKIMAAITLMSVLFLVSTIISQEGMSYMHDELHLIQELPPSQVRPAIDDLEATQHGGFFEWAPAVPLLGGAVALGLGVAIAISVISPLRRMGEAMRRIGAGDFSQPVQVENKDELGELAAQINRAAQDLARLQEATVMAERAQALQERILHVTKAQEEERRRISRELHDGLGPSLAFIVNKLRTCQEMVRTDPQQAESDLAEVQRSLVDHIKEIRELIYDLRPMVLDQLGLEGALRQQLAKLGREQGIDGSLRIADGIDLDPLTEMAIFRIVQECLSNAQRHANATRVLVSLDETDNGLELTVEDNGQGFNPAAAPARTVAGEKVGLVSMRERAELVGGSLSVESSPGQGCRITVRIRSAEVRHGVYSGHPS